jgi:hypothetical protein
VPAEPIAPSETRLSDPLTAPAFEASNPHVDEVSIDATSTPKAPRIRKTKSADVVLELGLTGETPERIDPKPTADGVTRLLVTAYMGIGHKLYLRGDGPGLSWEKGVPLQFVSIGKWLWETPAATSPFKAKLFKNDVVECVGLGELTVKPGQQHEVNAGV